MLKADRLAAGLRSLGVSAGDRVAVWAPNVPEWVLAQFATIRAGAVLVNLNPLYRSAELRSTLTKVSQFTLLSISILEHQCAIIKF